MTVCIQHETNKRDNLFVSQMLQATVCQNTAYIQDSKISIVLQSGCINPFRASFDIQHEQVESVRSHPREPKFEYPTPRTAILRTTVLVKLPCWSLPYGEIGSYSVKTKPNKQAATYLRKTVQFYTLYILYIHSN